MSVTWTYRDGDQRSIVWEGREVAICFHPDIGWVAVDNDGCAAGLPGSTASVQAQRHEDGIGHVIYCSILAGGSVWDRCRSGDGQWWWRLRTAPLPFVSYPEDRDD